MKLELSLYALNLPNVAGAFKGKSDPFAVVTVLATTPGSQPSALGKTEVVHNNLSPRWVHVFTLEHDLGTPKVIAVSIFDEVKKGQNRGMGSTVFDIDSVLGARGNTRAKRLKNGGTIFANVRKSVGSGVLKLQMKGIKLKNVDGMFGKSDPFFELSRKVENAGGLTWDNVYRSKVINNNLNPNWDSAVIELSILCGGNLDLPILIEVFDYEKNGKHKLIGKAEMSVNGMKNAASANTSIKIQSKGKDSGTLLITQCEIDGMVQERNTSLDTVTTTIPNGLIAPPPVALTAAIPVFNAPVAVPMAVPSAPVAVPTAAPPISRGNGNVGNDLFIDYISGGCELNLVVAIDFTGSNGDPRLPGTLHYMGGPDRNDYQKAIAAIVSILSKYDTDQKYPVYGFGAKYGGVVKHCFQCGPTEEVEGLPGILDAYSQVFKSGLVMSSPTLFNEVIDTAAARARASFHAAQNNRGMQSYTILLIVTDGAVSDPSGTAACLDRAIDAPLSIVIVGVGNANFSSMRFLDDYGIVGSGRRDIVQFVEFNKHKDSAVSLTSETLHEIPDQLTYYFQSRGIAPLPAIQRTDSILNSVEAADEQEIDLSLDIREDDIVVTGGGTNYSSGFGAQR